MSEVAKSAGCRNGVHDGCFGGFNGLDGPRACKCECHGNFHVVQEETQVGHPPTVLETFLLDLIDDPTLTGPEMSRVLVVACARHGVDPARLFPDDPDGIRCLRAEVAHYRIMEGLE